MADLLARQLRVPLFHHFYFVKVLLENLGQLCLDLWQGAMSCMKMVVPFMVIE